MEECGDPPHLGLPRSFPAGRVGRLHPSVLDEEGLVIKGSEREKFYWKERISWFFRRALWRSEQRRAKGSPYPRDYLEHYRASR